MGMWFRGLLSFLCLVLGVSAFVPWYCATSVVDVVASDPLGLCATVAGLGIAHPPPVLQDDVLFVVNKTGQVFAVRTSDGKQIWAGNLGNDVTSPA